MRPIGLVCVAACAARAPQRPMQLQRVILYQNGIGYFERAGHVGGDRVELRLARGELDDVLKTLTVIDRLGAGVATVDVPTLGEKDSSVELGVRLAAGRVHDVQVGYAVPTPTWKAAYRVVLDDKSLLQGWAMVNNASQEDWRDVRLVLATGAPMSLALDLHTPQYVARPDATGRLVEPTITGVVGDEHGLVADRDGDGILDVDDKCPNEPETVNGFDDDDGCPDRGRVVVTSTSLEILDSIVFAKDRDAIAPASRAILDAIAATLQGNPDIAKVEIGGHASADEDDPWGLASRRAAAVRAALVTRGVAAERLVVVPYGATQPIDRTAEDKNRRVAFIIAARRDASGDRDAAASHFAQASPRYDAATAQASVHSSAKPANVAGAVRYALSEPVSIRRGQSAMVSIINKPVTAEDALLFRPDAAAPGSDRHPFRAVRLANDSGTSLEPGPIAIFARGSFVGDSLIGRLDIGETAWVPYALEGGTTVTVERDGGDRPVRIVSISRGVVQVEHADVRATRYTIAAGADPARRIYIRHAKLAGYTISGLPPDTIDQGDAYLIPVPLGARKASTLAVEERSPRRRAIQLQDAGATELGLYVEGSHLPPAIAEKLATIIALRRQLGARDEQRESLRERLGELAERAEELRANLRAIEKLAGAGDLRKKLVTSLAAANADADALARQLAEQNEALATERAKLDDTLRAIELPET